ncbi:hypothetical protein ACXAT3_002679 [Clostridium sporogenes]
MAYVNLPFDFNEIIQYDSLKSIDCRLLGYNYNIKNNDFKLTISSIDKKIDDIDVYERIAGALKTSENNENDIQDLKQKLNRLENKVNTPNKIEEINTKDTSIIAGASNTVKINESGLSTHEVNNPDRGLIWNAGALGLKDGDDFEPIITADGIMPKFLPSAVNLQLEKALDNVGNIERNNNENRQEQRPPTMIKNPPIRYMDLTCKLIRNENNQVEQINYYNLQGDIEYIEKIIRNENGKIEKVEKEHLDAETQITTIIRDEETNLVTDVSVEYENDTEDYEFGGML